MKYMVSYISIGKLVFKNRVNAIEIRANWNQLSRLATIRFPRYRKFIDPSLTDYKIKSSDPVTIMIGYNDNLSTEFAGFVAQVSPTSPIEIKCEDQMWPLRQKIVSQSWSSITLKALIEFLVPGTDTSSCYDITLSPFRLNQVSVYNALQKLKDDLGLVIYFRNGRMYAGLAYNEADMPQVKYHFQKNASADNLVFRTKDQMKIKVKATSILPDNSRIVVEVGDEGGDQRTLTFYNITSEAELKRQAEERLERLRYDGFTGTIQAFGLPYIDHGYSMQLMDDKYPERSGICFADEVVTTYDSSGFKRVIKPGRTVIK